jgi:predicted lipoprotein with Yx(FWY)xxD motif
VTEVAAFAVLAALALAPTAPEADARARADGATAAPSRFPAQVPRAVARAAATTTAALEVAALALLAVAAAGASPSALAGTGTGLRATTIGGATVLANTRGFTLYWFAPDTASASKCYGSCAAYWPPVTGTGTASPGLPGRIGTIARTGGSRQLTYDGHPLYTYIGDTAPGQANGNNLNLNGGLWHEVVVTGNTQGVLPARCLTGQVSYRQGVLGGEAVPHLRRLVDWSPRCRLRRARTMTGSVAYAAAASSPVPSRTSSSHRGIPAMGDRMSAIGRRAGDGDGFAEGAGEAGVGPAVTGAEALAVLLVAGAAIPATGAGA